MVMNKTRTVFVLLSVWLLCGCAAMTEHRVGRSGDQLTACPAWPRCVSSFESSERHGIAALELIAEPQRAWAAARLAVAKLPRTQIVEEQDDYLRAEIRSPWYFYTDDLELLLDADQQQIHVRSTGRIGYYDFEVNRERVEALRHALCMAGQVRCKADESLSAR